MKRSICIISVLAAGYCSQAQSPAWTRFPAPADYQNYDSRDVGVGTDAMGNIYTAASEEDTVNNVDQAVLVKYDPSGAQQWIKYYNAGNSSYDSYVRALLVDQAGNCYVCGYGYHNNTTTRDIMLLKYDNTGSLLWSKYWDGGQNDYDYSTCATFDASGNILVGGYGYVNSNTGYDMELVKWSPAGTLLWSYAYNNSAINDEDVVYAVTTDRKRNVFITGSSFGSVARDGLTIKLDSAGNNKWTNRLAHGSDGDDDCSYSVAADTAGNSYITGVVDDWVTVKYGPTGNTLWTNTYTDNGLERYNIKKVLVDKHNRVVVCGDAFAGSAQSSDLVVSDLDYATGAQNWSASYNYGGIDAFMDATVDTAGNIYMGGNFDGSLGTDISASILTADGTTIFGTTYSNPSNTAGVDEAYQVTVDPLHNLIIAGLAETRSDQGSSSTDPVDVMVLKYAALPLGIRENQMIPISLQLFPNPSNGQTTLRLSDPRIIGASINISNITGQQVYQDKLSALSQALDLSSLAPGVYLVTIKNGQASASQKLIIR